MTKKKEHPIKEKTGIRKVDYIALIESLSEKGFDYCVDCIFPMLTFKVLKRKDLRRIDIEEKILYRIEYLYYRTSSPRIEENCAVNHFVTLIEMYLSAYIYCIDGSRAARYSKRAAGLINKLKDDNGSEEDLFDLVMLFISFFRAYKNTGEASALEDISLGIEKSDINTIKWFAFTYDIEPAIKGKLKTGKNPAKSLSSSTKEFLFITTTLYACRLMQEEDAFEEDN